MGNRSWRAWDLPQVPQQGRKGVTEQEGSYMPGMGATRLRKHESCSHPKPGVGSGLRCTPLACRGERARARAAPLVAGQCGGSLASPCVGVGWRQEGGAGASCPEGRGYQSTAPSRFPYPGSARSRQYVLLVTHHSFPLPSVCLLREEGREREE